MSAILRDGAILLHLRLRIFSRLILPRFTPEAQRSAPYRLGAMILVGASCLLFVAWGLGYMLSRALGAASGSYLLPALAWAPAAAIVGIFFYAVLIIAGTFTYRNDLTVLMATPMSIRMILADKLLAVSGSFSALLLVVALPNVIGAGGALHAGLSFDLVALLVVLLLPIPPVALAMLLTIVALRWLPPATARTGAIILGMAAAAAFYIATDSSGAIAVTGPTGDWSWLPTTWPGEALVNAAQGHGSIALIYLGGTFALAAVLGGLAVDRSTQLLASGWTVYHEVGRRPANRPLTALDMATAQPARRPWARLRPSWWPLVRKEWLTLRRDPKLLAQLAYPLAIEGYTFYHAFGNPITAHPVTGRLIRYFAGLLYISTTLTALFLLTILALPIVSREGRSLYLLGLLPSSARDVFAAKLTFCAAPVLILTEGLLLSFGARLLTMTWQQTLFAALVLAALVIALASWLVCVGLMWPRLSSDQSRRQIHGTALLVGPTSGVLLCALVGLLLVAVYVPRPHAAMSPGVAAAAIFVVTGTVVAAVLAAGPGIMRQLLTGDRKPA